MRMTRIVRRAALIALGLLLAIYFYVPTSSVADTSLDVSNYVSYSHFAATGAHYGDEVLPLAGPYGFIMYGHTYGGELFWTRYTLEWLLKLCFAALSLWFLSRLTDWKAKGAWLLTLLILITSVEDASYDLLVLITGMFLLLTPSQTARSRIFLGAASCLLALLALMKGTQLSLSLLTLVLVGGSTFLIKEYAKLRLVLLSYLTAFTGLWLVMGQRLGDLPRYVHAVFDLSSGYHDAMGLQEPPRMFITGATAEIALLILFGLLLLHSIRRHQPMMGVAILLGAFSFVTWKHGFVRADGHVFIHYRYAIFLAVTGVVLGICRQPGQKQSSTRTRTASLLIPGVIAAVCGFVGSGQDVLPTWHWQFTRIPGLFAKSFAFVTSPASAKAALDEELDARRIRYALVEARDQIGSASVDYFGVEQGYLLLNEMNYQPRPMGGGTFSVFTAWLQQQNAAFVADRERAPHYYLANLYPLDNRLTSAEDGLALRELLQHYRPVGTDLGIVVFEQRPAPPAPDQGNPVQLISQVDAVAFGDPIEVPQVSADELLLVSFDLPLNHQGQIRKFLYKPPQIFLTVEGEDVIEGHYRRLIPEMVKNPVILTPFLETNNDLVRIYEHSSFKEVRTIALNSPRPGLWAADDFTVSFYRSPKPPALETAQLRSLFSRLAFPFASRPPVAVNAPTQSNRSLTFFQLPPPSSVDFALSGDETSIEIGYGIEDLAWTEGKTDGATLEIDLISPTGSVQHCFHRHINPAVNAEDRGFQYSVVALPVTYAPDSILRVRSGYGPNGDGAWDWLYLTRIMIREGAFESVQFPTFQNLPTAVHGNYCSALQLGDRTVVMLNAPGALDFALEPETTRVIFDGGFVPGAYTEGQTDGADYVIELVAADGTITEVGRRPLRPIDRPADRGIQSFSFELPGHVAASLVRVRIDPGPDGNDAWDWTYLANLRLE